MSETKTPKTDAKVLELEPEEDHYYEMMIDHARSLEADLSRAVEVAVGALEGLLPIAEYHINKAYDEGGSALPAGNIQEIIDGICALAELKRIGGLE